ncbi:MAG: hypothetical protein SFV51_04635 [Bryobacteraceae bacterium]|nr:hypothetical protein [Bryobacteraceae bacterium]
MNTTPISRTAVLTETLGLVHCPICTHNVEAIVLVDRRTARVKPGQRCKRCNSTIDAGFVMRMDKAA